MGNQANLKSQLSHGQGYRVISVKKGSPFQNLIEPFFDFMMTFSSTSNQVTSKIPNIKEGSNNSIQSCEDTFIERLKQYQNVQLTLKIVNTKYRVVREIVVTPNKQWGNGDDITGITVRKQRYDEVYDTYCIIKDIFDKSPIKQAQIIQGEYLIGCTEIKYVEISQLIDGAYNRFFDKQIKNKSIHLVVYNILSDQLKIKLVHLRRNWGGKGLLGCQFLQGYLYRFPRNLKQYRQKLLESESLKKRSNENKSYMQQKLSQLQSLQKNMINSTKVNKKQKSKYIKDIYQLLSVQPPYLEGQKQQKNEKNDQQTQYKKLQFLQKKVNFLQSTINEIIKYVDKLCIQQDRQKQQEMV